MQVKRINRVFSFVIGIVSALLSLQVQANSFPTPDIAEKIYKDLFLDLSDSELEARIMKVTNLFEPKFTSEVKGFLRIYLTSRPEWTQTLLGRTHIFFPIFERKIEEKGLPNDIKIVSIIESALRTEARSRVGAQGLWQFMPGTAKDNDLVIDKYVDEREDPYRATDAALEYLTDLYKRYHDWALAIAAYNSGPGRVNQAIALSGVKNFWHLRNYLPKETRNYVPAFLAAKYMMKHYQEYYLSPNIPRLDFQITKAFKIYNEISFTKIAEITGISREDLNFLNTSYRKDFIPSNTKGFTLLLPARVAPKMEAYLNNIEAGSHAKHEETKPEPFDSTLMDQLFYSHVLYDAQPNEKLQDIADLFNVDKYNIRHWNGMSSDEIDPAKPLEIHYVKNENRISVVANTTTRKFTKRNKLSTVKLPINSIRLNSSVVKKLPEFIKTVDIKANSPLNLDLQDHYRLRRGESLQDVMRKFPNLTLEQIQTSLLTPSQSNSVVVSVGNGKS